MSTVRSLARPGTSPSLFIVAIFSALALTGCNGIRLHLGMRTQLAKLPVVAMAASLAQNPGIAPGEKSPLVASFNEANGKVWVTEGKGHGRIQWRDIAVATTLVTYKGGNLYLSSDPRISEGKTGHVAITVPSHPGLMSEFDVPVRYDYPFTAYFPGRSGSSGFNGSDGTSGSTGSTGSFDPAHPSAGGNGGSGTDGTNGGDGGRGGDGPDVEVRITMRPGPLHLVQCAVSIPGRSESFYLIDPNGGSLTVSSAGGSGGSGGRGGHGGSGGSGGSGIPPGSSGSSGSDGRNGSDGASGRNGSVTVYFDSSVANMLGMIHVERGSSSFVEDSIPDLW